MYYKTFLSSEPGVITKDLNIVLFHLYDVSTRKVHVNQLHFTDGEMEAEGG